MLLPLSHDENSAHNVYKFISHVVWYTDYITPHSLAGVLDMGPQEGTWVLTRSRTLFEYGNNKYRWALIRICMFVTY